MSLPLALNHINLWALEDGAGWTLVDTGMHTEETATAWQSVLSGPMADRPVQRVICTHMHPDHIGMAGWLTRRFGCQLWTSRLEYLTCRTLVADTGRDPVPLMAAALELVRPYPNIELLWASPRELLNIVQADAIGCHIITVTHDLLKKLPSLDRDLDGFSLDTVKMFHRDAQGAGYQL